MGLTACGGSSDQPGTRSTVAAAEGEAAEEAGQDAAKATAQHRAEPKTRMSKAAIEKLSKLTIPKQSGPPPRHLEIVDLRKGTGARVTKRDAVDVRYFQVQYPEVRRRSRSGLYGPHTFGLDETVKGWTVGLPGMKVGGRRELIVPPKLAYPRWKPSWGYSPYVRVYVIDLIGIEARS